MRRGTWDDCVFLCTHIERFGVVASLAAALPLAGQVVDGRGGCRLRRLDGRRCGGLCCLLRRGLHGLCDCLDTVHREVEVLEDALAMGFLAAV